MRAAVLGHWYGEDPEHYAELRVLVSEPEPATYWEPPYPGDIEPDELHIDGERVDMGEHWPLVRKILDTEEVPEVDYEW